ncbi:MAG: anti-sigma factor antagonist [Streptosporangiaceae bacterium]|nr:anti-sigma factor antagonist [Streptosporangiaceae bacterium]
MKDGMVTVILGGELDLLCREFLSEHLMRVAASEPQRLVFDMAGVRFVDCDAARALANTGRFLPYGSRPVIRNPRPAVRRLFQLTGLDAYCVLEEGGHEHLRS